MSLGMLGIRTQMPLALRHLSRIFRPENVLSIIAAVSEMQGLTGFSPSGLIAFRPQRLVVFGA
jgi:hypothetical protein